MRTLLERISAVSRLRRVHYRSVRQIQFSQRQAIVDWAVLDARDSVAKLQSEPEARNNSRQVPRIRVRDSTFCFNRKYFQLSGMPVDLGVGWKLSRCTHLENVVQNRRFGLVLHEKAFRHPEHEEGERQDHGRNDISQTEAAGCALLDVGQDQDG